MPLATDAVASPLEACVSLCMHLRLLNRSDLHTRTNLHTRLKQAFGAITLLQLSSYPWFCRGLLMATFPSHPMTLWRDASLLLMSPGNTDLYCGSLNYMLHASTLGQCGPGSCQARASCQIFTYGIFFYIIFPFPSPMLMLAQVGSSRTPKYPLHQSCHSSIECLVFSSVSRAHTPTIVCHR